jgi:GalNAc-alpha-(1->4)-GalNAc-alpha-(1->3)-diNAcBac-PP-undecaprenol alpha-1,4-N-acetyl-D-galactosaminyltransferase
VFKQSQGVQNHKLVLVIPSLIIGGMERVITELANFYAENELVEVHLIKLTRGNNGFNLLNTVRIYEPTFDHKQFNPLLRSLKTGLFLRSTIKRIVPDAILSFGDRYNAFTILFSLGLSRKIYVSNRMNPFASNGRAIDFFNKMLYPYASGIIAQTQTAKSVFEKRYRHANVTVIGNPVKKMKPVGSADQQNIILNVGRFGDEKKQELLVQYFYDLNPSDWRLVFIGDGAKMPAVKERVLQLQMDDRVVFAGSVSEIEDYYRTSEIFAFTSTSEGFPNALAEALNTPLACISFDCLTGPSDLIEDGVNGFLVDVMDHEAYKLKLERLIKDPELRVSFKKEAKIRIQKFNLENIAEQYLKFILPS